MVLPGDHLRRCSAPTRASRPGSPATTASTTCSTGRATPRSAPPSACMAITFYMRARDRWRQRHHRRHVPPVDQHDHLGPAGRRCSSCRRSCSSSPSGPASACSVATATCCCTAARPAASCGCPHGEFIEVHEPLWTRTSPSSLPRSTSRHPGAGACRLTECANKAYHAAVVAASAEQLLLRRQRCEADRRGDRSGPAPCGSRRRHRGSAARVRRGRRVAAPARRRPPPPRHGRDATPSRR